MKAKLRILKGAAIGKEIVISGSQFVIGRAEGCHLRPKTDAVSRRHCALLLDGDKAVVRDLGSRNGTEVNGTKIDKEQALANGDQIRVGPLTFEFCCRKPAAVDAATGPKKPGDSGVIGDWLSEIDDGSHGGSGSMTTREFKLDPQHETVGASGDTTRIIKPDPKQDKKDKGKKGKKQPGKLPPLPVDDSGNTQEAAAAMLRKMFNRGG